VQYGGDAVVLGVYKGAALPEAASQADEALGGLLRRLQESGEITGRQSEVTIVHTQQKLPAPRVVVVGLGESSADGMWAVRRAMGAAARTLQDRGCRRLATTLHQQAPQGVRPGRAVRALVESAYVGIYKGGECKSEEAPGNLEEIAFLGLLGEESGAVADAVSAGRAAGQAANRARQLVNLPPNDVTPSRLTEYAVEMAKGTDLEVEILDAERMAALGMGALLAVAQGSQEPGRLIVLRHHGKTEGRPRVAFIGKGMTFDSGGISLKPSDKMETMKQDMAGAAAVLGAMGAVAELDLDLDVIGLVPAAENLPSGSAYRPGDVLRSLSGKTIEVISTDAEGRLLLADTLTYACQLGATHLIDIATLTGACIIALGHVASGVMGNDSALVDAVIDAAEGSGERTWRLPLYPEYRQQLDSEVADIKNVGGRAAGAITGGWFLREFVGDTAWVHIDIAGTAWVDKAEPDRVKGGTGAGTRTLIALAERLSGGLR
jgi:leucyl aminopeptidase